MGYLGGFINGLLGAGGPIVLVCRSRCTKVRPIRAAAKWRASKHCAGPYQDGKGATFILPLDEGFVAASNRTVEEMVAEVEGSTISALEFWLGQWIIPELLPTVSATLAGKHGR